MAFAATAGLPEAALAGSDGSGGKNAQETQGPQGPKVPELSSPPKRPSPFRISVGPLSAIRSMKFEGDDTTVLHQPHPYVGGTMSMSGAAWKHPKLDIFLSYTLDVGYGIAKNRKFDPLQNGSTPITEMSYGGARLFIDRRLAKDLYAGIGGGIQATSVIVQPNSLYTGHRYLGGETALRFRWHGLADTVIFGAGASIYPVFALDNSDDGHGRGTAFGARLESELAWRIAPGAQDENLRHLNLVIRYRFERYRSQFPNSPVGSRGGISVDNLNVAGLLIQYAAPP